MSELESAEQYVRTHELIESLRAERRPARDAGDEEDARLSATAALLHAASPDGATVDPTFAERLFARLEVEQERQALAPAAAETAPALQASGADVIAAEQPTTRRGRSGVSRRGLLWGGLGAAAAALTGAAVTAALEQSGSKSPNTPPASALVPTGTGAWVAVARLDAVPLGAVRRFEAGAVIGYLQHTASGFLALSGVCTHMACLLQWNSGERTFDCPCHGGRFLANGEAAPGARYMYAPLPAIQTKVDAEQVWVYVTGSVNAQDPSVEATATHGGYDSVSAQSGK